MRYYGRISIWTIFICSQIQDDIQYLRNAFALDQSDESAANLFAKLIRSALGTKATNINFAIHIWAHSD